MYVSLCFIPFFSSVLLVPGMCHGWIKLFGKKKNRLHCFEIECVDALEDRVYYRGLIYFKVSTIEYLSISNIRA